MIYMFRRLTVVTPKMGQKKNNSFLGVNKRFAFGGEGEKKWGNNDDPKPLMLRHQEKKNSAQIKRLIDLPSSECCLSFKKKKKKRGGMQRKEKNK